MRISKVFTYLILILLGLSGCSIVSHMDELMLMKGYSNEKDAQHKLVKSINDHYDELCKAIDQKTVNDNKDEASWVKSFGEPILKKDLSDGTQRWLYRYAIYRLAKSKVYVYFNRDGKLIKWEKLTCPSFF